MIYIYAPSMATVVLASKVWDFEKIIIISFNDSIQKFCSEANVLFISIKSNNDKSFKGLKTHRNYLKEVSEKYNNKTFFFSFYGFDYWGLYFMEKLSGNNTILFNNIDHIYPEHSFKKQYNKYALQKRIDKLILTYLCKIKYKYFSISQESHFIGLSPSLLEEKYPFLISINTLIFNQNKKYIQSHFLIQKSKAIFIDQGKSRYSVPDKIIDTLKKHFTKNQLLIKEHPNFEISNEKLYSFKQIPKHIPIELITNDDQIIIGIASTSMLNINNITISIINLIIWKNYKDKIYYYSILDNSILKPNSIEELCQIIKQIN